MFEITWLPGLNIEIVRLICSWITQHLFVFWSSKWRSFELLHQSHSLVKWCSNCYGSHLRSFFLNPPSYLIAWKCYTYCKVQFFVCIQGELVENKSKSKEKRQTCPVTRVKKYAYLAVIIGTNRIIHWNRKDVLGLWLIG